MLKPYDTHETLSEQDYGPWLDRLSLYEHDGKVYLREQSGYSRPYESQWYELNKKPEKTLEVAFGGDGWKAGGYCGAGPQHGERCFGDALDVSVTRCAVSRPFDFA